MVASQQLQCTQTIVNNDATLVDGIFRFVDDCQRTTLVQGTLGKLVAIERTTFEGEKDGTFRTVTAVGSDVGMLFEQLV